MVLIVKHRGVQAPADLQSTLEWSPCLEQTSPLGVWWNSALPWFAGPGQFHITTPGPIQSSITTHILFVPCMRTKFPSGSKVNCWPDELLHAVRATGRPLLVAEVASKHTPLEWRTAPTLLTEGILQPMPSPASGTAHRNEGATGEGFGAPTA